MNSTVLTVKYRPKTFSEIVGQKPPKQILQNAIKYGKINPVYLFFGPFGTGKTSLARVFAMAVNCDAPVDGQPCTKCDSCKDIVEGRNRLVTEVDAASHRDVDSMEILKDLVSYEVGKGKHKMIILDECHMLSKAAQSSLLKLLEEPPSQVIFVLVTTDPANLADTIRSRCMSLQFRKLTVIELVNALRVVAHREGKEVSEKALYMIARNSFGALRDAEKVLDLYLQMDDTSVDALADMLGILTREDMGLLAEMLLSGDSVLFSEGLGELQSRGISAEQIYDAMMLLLRDMMISKVDTEGKLTYDSMIPYSKFVEKVTVSYETLVTMFGRLTDKRRFRSVLEIEMAYIDMAYTAGLLEVADGAT